MLIRPIMLQNKCGAISGAQPAVFKARTEITVSCSTGAFKHVFNYFNVNIKLTDLQENAGIVQ
jgi:hypothetical protein